MHNSKLVITLQNCFRQLNKANTSDTETPFLDLHLSISNGFVSSKIYDNRDDFDFDIVNFPFLDGDVSRRPSYGVYISQHIGFARVCSHVEDFNARYKCLTAKLLKQGYRYYAVHSKVPGLGVGGGGVFQKVDVLSS